MTISVELNSFNDYRNLCWSGAIQTLDAIEEANMESEFVDFMDSIFEDAPSDTTVNDFIWFDSDYIFEQLGIDPYGELEDDEDEDEDDDDYEDEDDEEGDDDDYEDEDEDDE